MPELVKLMSKKTSLLLSLLFNSLLFSYLHIQCSEQQAQQDGLTHAATHLYFSPGKTQVLAASLEQPSPFATCKSLLSPSASRLRALWHPCHRRLGAGEQRTRRLDGNWAAGALPGNSLFFHPQKSFPGILPFSRCLFASA